jgi:hypothetical protein
MINRMRRYKGFEVITEKQGLVSYLQQAGCRLDCRSVVYKERRRDRGWNIALQQKSPTGEWITLQMRFGLRKKWGAMRIAAELLEQLLDDQQWIDPSVMMKHYTVIWEYLPVHNVWTIHRGGFSRTVGIETVRYLNQRYGYPNEQGRLYKLFGEGIDPNKQREVIR